MEIDPQQPNSLFRWVIARAESKRRAGHVSPLSDPTINPLGITTAEEIQLYTDNLNDIQHESSSAFRTIIFVYLSHMAQVEDNSGKAGEEADRALSLWLKTAETLADGGDQWLPDELPARLEKVHGEREKLEERIIILNELHASNSKLMSDLLRERVKNLGLLAQQVEANTIVDSCVNDARMIRKIANAGARPIYGFINSNGGFDKRGTPIVLNVNDIIAEVYSVRSVAGAVDFQMDLGAGLDNCLVDAGLLYCVIDNLWRNAKEACSSIKPEPHFLVSTKPKRRGLLKGIEFEVCDEGPGMKPELRIGNRALQRGVSTKNRGSGSGLYISSEVIKAAGGVFYPIESRTKEECTGDETTFTRFGFWLPTESTTRYLDVKAQAWLAYGRYWHP